MTTSTATLEMAREELAAAGEAWETFAEAWGMLRRRLEGTDLLIARQIEAYQPFTRDQGMGDEPDDWFAHIEQALDEAQYGAGEDDES